MKTFPLLLLLLCASAEGQTFRYITSDITNAPMDVSKRIYGTIRTEVVTNDVPVYQHKTTHYYATYPAQVVDEWVDCTPYCRLIIQSMHETRLNPTSRIEHIVSRTFLDITYNGEPRSFMLGESVITTNRYELTTVQEEKKEWRKR